MTLQEAKDVLGVSRQRLNQLIKAGDIPSRLELGEEGRARRILKRSDVDAFLQQRRKEAAEQTGRGRRIKLPD